MLWAIVSSFLLYLSFSYPWLSWLAWFAFVPCLVNSLFNSKREAFIYFFLIGFCLHLALLYWLIKVSFSGYVFLSFYIALYYGVFGIFYYSYYRYRLLLSLLWVFLEIIRELFLLGFPWLPLASSQHSNSYFIQLASFIGCYGLSGIIIYSNLILTDTFIIRSKLNKKKLLCFFFVIVLLCGYGFFRMSLGEKKSENNLKIGIVNSKVPLSVKWNRKLKPAIIQKYINVSRDLKQENCDLIIWPETSVPDYLLYRKNIYDKISFLARGLHSYLLIGALDYVSDPEAKKKYFNSQFLFSNDGSLVGKYDKLKLVPWGEYVPLKKHWPWLKRFAVRAANFSKGEKHTKFLCPGFVFSTIICYEDIFTFLVRKFALHKPDFLLISTNDAWFYRAQYKQRICMALFRAIEFGIPLLRCSNMGASCVIDRFGRIVKYQEKEGTIICTIDKADAKPTFYLRYGPYLFWMLIWICIFGFGAIIIKERSKNQQKQLSTEGSKDL